MSPFDFVFSVGRDCACAIHLRRNGLRDMSSPFDWLGFVPLDVRIRLIEGDFGGFLVKRNLRRIDKPDDVDVRCDYYLDSATGFEHLHDFPRGVPLDESYPRVRAKYDRRIRRFQDRLARGGRALMVWWDKSGRETDETFLEAVERVQAKYPACEINLLVFQHDPAMAAGTSMETRLSERVTKITGCLCPTPSVCGDFALTGRCLRKVPRSGRIRKAALSQRLRKCLAKLLSCWHLNRAARRKSRKAWQERLHAVES